MADIAVHRSDDPAVAYAAAESFLLTEPARHNIVLSLLHERMAHPEPGRYWWVSDEQRVVGVAMQSPATFTSTMTPMPVHAIGPLVDTMAVDAPDLPGINGDAATTASFAGCWSEVRNTGAHPREGQRLYRLAALRPPAGVAGELRVADAGDTDLIVTWSTGFQADTGAGIPGGPDELRLRIARRIDAGVACLWCDGSEPVSMVLMSVPVAGAVRVGQVYTPPEHRRHGYASAAVAAASGRALADAAVGECVLYTQLSNPTSNGIYRAIGFEAVAEVLVYDFDA